MTGGYKEFAISLALKAGNVMRQNFTIGMHKEWKEDNSPLTATDLAVNDLVIREVRKNFSDHGVLAEEASYFNGEEYVWVCDPVDGTNPFSHGYPAFTFSLALLRSGRPILGVLYDPTLNRLLSAESGKGTYLNSEPVRVNESPSLARSIVSLESGSCEIRRKLLDSGCLVTTFSCITYPAMLVAMGEFAAAIWQGKTPWDGAAIQIIIEEANGACTNIDGLTQRYDAPINGIIASNKQIHPVLLKMIKDLKNPKL